MAKKNVQTIGDIARLANVSKSTVSRALNNSPLISKETRERIQAIAREHQFRLNAPAQNLSTRQSRTIAFVTQPYKDCCSSEDLFMPEMMTGISSGLFSLGYDFLVIHADPYDTEWIRQYLDSGRVDGFVLMTSSHKQTHLKTLAEMSAPFIVWGIPMPNYVYCSVNGDNVTGGRLATEHLIGIGRQRIAYLGGPIDEIDVQQRFKGYEIALKANGRSINPEMLTYGDYSHDSGIYAMNHLLEVTPDLDAVFVNSDLMATGAIRAIQDLGKHVPEDIAVVGYDDLAIANYHNPPLTTVRQNIPLAGKLLAENLVQLIQTGVVTNVTVPVELVVRKSA